IVLHFHVPSRTPQQPYERVAERGITQMPDVRGFVGIDVGVLDHALRLSGRNFVRAGMRGLRERCREKSRAVEIEIDVAPTGQLCARDSRNCGQFRSDLLRNLSWRTAQSLGLLKGDRRGYFAH